MKSSKNPDKPQHDQIPKRQVHGDHEQGRRQGGLHRAARAAAALGKQAPLVQGFTCKQGFCSSRYALDPDSFLLLRKAGAKRLRIGKPSVKQGVRSQNQHQIGPFAVAIASRFESLQPGKRPAGDLLAPDAAREGVVGRRQVVARDALFGQQAAPQGIGGGILELAGGQITAGDD